MKLAIINIIVSRWVFEERFYFITYHLFFLVFYRKSEGGKSKTNSMNMYYPNIRIVFNLESYFLGILSINFKKLLWYLFRKIVLFINRLFHIKFINPRAYIWPFSHFPLRAYHSGAFYISILYTSLKIWLL